MIYKPQIDNTNFVYPNFDLAEYDVDIIHVPNDNSVSGTVTSISATTVTSSSLQFTYSASWSLNGAEPFISPASGFDGTLAWSIHIMAAGQNYYKPWRLTGGVLTTPTTGSTTYSVTNATTVIVTPTRMGLTTFVSGTYYVEFRFIGANSIYPVMKTLSITVP